MPSSDELADAELHMQSGPMPIEVRQERLRALARDAAKQALLDAANEWRRLGWRDGPPDWLRARAEQIGTRDGD